MTTVIPCSPCRTLECSPTNDSTAYTLNNGTLVTNPAITIEIPQPPGIYTIPAGTIKLVVSDNPISPLRLLGCECEIVQDIEGLTQDGILGTAQFMVNEAAEQQGRCNNNLVAVPEADCPSCRTLECTNINDTTVYTLNDGTLVTNQTTTIPIPQPPGTYTIPTGTIKLVISSSQTPPLRLLGCECEIVQDIDGFTQDQILAVAQGMVNEAAEQQGRCNNNLVSVPEADCPPCRVLECSNTNDALVYTLNDGTLYENETTFIPIDIPPGVYEVPAGAVQFVVSNNPISPLRLLGCQCELVQDIEGMTPDQISATAINMVNNAVIQYAECKNQKPNLPFFNEIQIISCSNNTLINLVGNPPLPNGVSFIDGKLVIAPGIITSEISFADANAKALTLLQSLLSNLMAQGKANCGFWNTAQTFTCPEGSPSTTVPAFTVFSQISQDDADAQALALAEEETVCGSVNPCTDGVGSISNNIYGIEGYFDGLFVATEGPSDCTIVWDGTFPVFNGSDTFYATSSTAEPCGGILMDGFNQCDIHIQLNCDGDNPFWIMSVQGPGDLWWVGELDGSNTPVGIYSQTSGGDPGPASVTVIQVGTGTTAGSMDCGT